MEYNSRKSPMPTGITNGMFSPKQIGVKAPHTRFLEKTENTGYTSE